MERKQKSLLGVTSEYPITLVDTSSLIEPMNGRPDKGDKSYEARILSCQRGRDSAIFLRSFLEQGGIFYVTSRVLEEYRPKTLESIGSSRGLEHKLFIERQEGDKEVMRFIERLEYDTRIFQLRDEEIKYHDFFSRKYIDIMDRGGLSETDFDFLIVGGVIAKVRGKPVSLVSNDFSILYSWNEFVKREKTAPENFGFFIRIETDVFEKADHPKNYKKI